MIKSTGIKGHRYLVRHSCKARLSIFELNKSKYQRKFEDVHEKPEFRFQAFIQAVLLVSVFEQRLSFRLFCFMKNDREIILRCGWGFGGAVSSSCGTAPENVFAFLHLESKEKA